MRFIVPVYLFIALCASACDLLPVSETANEIEPIPTLAVQQDFVDLWWIIQEDGGNTGLPIGCMDSIFQRPSDIPVNLTVEETLQRGLSYLTDNSNIGEGYGTGNILNPLSQATLELLDFAIDGDHVTVNLSGNLNLSGICTNTKIEPQLVLNIMTLTNTHSATIYKDGENIRHIFDMSAQDTRTIYTWDEFQLELVEFWVISKSGDYPNAIPVACDYYVVPRKTTQFVSGDVATDLQAAFNGLFIFDPTYYENTDDLINHYLIDQGVFVDDFSIEDAHATVYIVGQLQSNGDCIDLAVEAQIIQTIFQFDDIQSATIMHGDMNLRQLVDQSNAPTLAQYVYTRSDP